MLYNFEEVILSWYTIRGNLNSRMMLGKSHIITKFLDE